MSELVTLAIRVRGRVQGVGFRPTVWRLARELGLDGNVSNDAEGVLIFAAGPQALLTTFLQRLEREAPPLARVEKVETAVVDRQLPSGFCILASSGGASRTQVAPDAVVCADCAGEVLDPSARRFGYPFTTCTHCGPRLSVVVGVPYDRALTTLAPFDLCADCRAEYENPADRRFHAETMACPLCGPRLRLERLDGRAMSFDPLSLIDAAVELIERGEIVAIKGLGGFHLACDATQAGAVERLRHNKQRDAKPFALMARDLDVIRRYALVSEIEEAALRGPEAPIVLLQADGEMLPPAVAPNLRTLGFMLPTTPLHLLLLRGMERPVVMTSGNLSDEPQAIGDDDARKRLASITGWALFHDRDIANRVDDSVARVSDGKMRVLRRARGYAPAPLSLPPGFAGAPPILAYGGELKATFCLLRDGEAILSQHQGDLEDASTFADYQRNLELYRRLFDHEPTALAVDLHPNYSSRQLALNRGLPLIEVQHHHAHIAACLADNDRPLDAPPVVGVALDGLGYGDDGTVWGGEFFVADYRGYRRCGTFKPVAMLGGDQASREPWRNLYAHLMAEMGWSAFTREFAQLELHARLAQKPRALLDKMLLAGLQSPLASSCGRLFDAFCAAIDVAFERQAYEGEAATRLESLASAVELGAYPFSVVDGGLPYIEPLAMWNAALRDLISHTPAEVMAARFHRGLAGAIVAMVKEIVARDISLDTVALSGGCFHNRVLHEEVARRLRADGLHVLSHSRIPSGDGGLALGQAVIAAARLI